MKVVQFGSARAVAAETFGKLKLHAAQRAQVIRVTRLVLSRPSGTVAQTSRDGADRQSMYGLLEGPVSCDALLSSICDTTAERCRPEPFVFVPVDGSSIAVTDPARCKGTGRTGSPPAQGRGLKTMAAIAVTPEGTPLGITALKYWARGKKRTRGHQMVPIEKRESYNWISIVREVLERFAKNAPGCKPWFQLDREGDFTEMLMLAASMTGLLTVRSKTDRMLEDGGRLRARLRDCLPLGCYALQIPARHGRASRIAQIEVRACPVKLAVAELPSKRRHIVPMTAVQAREIGPVHGHDRIEWTLLTTKTTNDFETARVVINGYARRWSIEEVFRTWKSGLCDVESMQLRSYGALTKWATLLSMAAARATYLAHVARQKPDASARDVLSEADLEALVVVRNPKDLKPGDPITIRQAVRWIADLGGYVGNNRSGEPGKITIGRGLIDLEIAVLAIAAYKKSTARAAKRSKKS